jgi:uncharacterized protein YndB with AHSA1/START domain
MTFKAGQVEDNPYENETIAIELVAQDGQRTELTLTNRWDGPAMDDEDIEATKQGWSAWLDLLAEALA